MMKGNFKKNPEKMKEVKIGNQIWTLENFSGTTCPDGTELELGKDYFYPNRQEYNVKDYGLLYTLEASKKVCPKGWQLPTNEDWDELEKNLSIDKWINKIFWVDGKLKQASTDNVFNVVPAGYYNENEYGYFGANSTFWSATMDDNSNPYYCILGCNSPCSYMYSCSRYHEPYGHSVRFVRYPSDSEKHMEEYIDKDLENLGQETDKSILTHLYNLGKEKCLSDIPFDKLYTMRLEDDEHIAEVGFVWKRK